MDTDISILTEGCESLWIIKQGKTLGALINGTIKEFDADDSETYWAIFQACKAAGGELIPRYFIRPVHTDASIKPVSLAVVRRGSVLVDEDIVAHFDPDTLGKDIKKAFPSADWDGKVIHA